MKKKILFYSKFTCAFVGLYLLNSLGASAAVQGRIMTTNCFPSGDSRYEGEAVSYPLLFLKGSKNIEADPKKGFDLLQDISARLC